MVLGTEPEVSPCPGPYGQVPSRLAWSRSLSSGLSRGLGQVIDLLRVGQQTVFKV
jgi:hypothetical protein